MFSHTDKVDPRAEEPLSLHSQQALIEKGIAVISRLCKNAVDWDDPPEDSGRERPRKRGKKWKLADLLKVFGPESLTVHIYEKESQVATVVRDV